LPYIYGRGISMGQDAKQATDITLPRNSRHLQFRKEDLDSPGTSPRTDSKRETSKRDSSKRSMSRQRTFSEDKEPCTLMTVWDAAGRDLKLEKFPKAEVFEWDCCLEMIDQILEQFRAELRLSSFRVLELGCGLGVPSMVCAAMGADVMATDLEDALVCIKKNGSINGYPQNVWEVTGGARSGGLICQMEMNYGDMAKRLQPGALVEELEKIGNFLKFELLRGEGPKTGWVKMKRFGMDPDLRKTEERPHMPGVGGILRTGVFEFNPQEVPSLMGEGGFFDVVIACDCVYEPAYGTCYMELADCFEALCGPDTVIFLTLMHRLYDGSDVFMERIREGPLLVKKLRPSLACTGKIEMFSLRRESRSENCHVMINSKVGPPEDPAFIKKLMRKRAERQKTFEDELKRAEEAARKAEMGEDEDDPDAPKEEGEADEGEAAADDADS
jgi:predicted nicotinamide N-methyase